MDADLRRYGAVAPFGSRESTSFGVRLCERSTALVAKVMSAILKSNVGSLCMNRNRGQYSLRKSALICGWLVSLFSRQFVACPTKHELCNVIYSMLSEVGSVRG
jgi:hypothetical protein